jgi:hypothetical protein
MKTSYFATTKGLQALGLEDLRVHKFMYNSLHLFLCQHWGDVCEEDALLNDQAMKNGDRVIGVYKTDLISEGEMWIIADAEDEEGKRVVTMLLPSEY